MYGYTYFDIIWIRTHYVCEISNEYTWTPVLHCCCGLWYWLMMVWGALYSRHCLSCLVSSSFFSHHCPSLFISLCVCVLSFSSYLVWLRCVFRSVCLLPWWASLCLCGYALRVFLLQTRLGYVTTSTTVAQHLFGDLSLSLLYLYLYLALTFYIACGGDRW